MPHNKKVLSDTLKSWLPLAAAIIILSGMAYCAVRQNYRQSANDPQVQIAEDVVDAISQGTPADSITGPTGNTDIKKSLSAFILIYDDSGKLVGSSAVLDGKNPEYPGSLLDNVRKDGMQKVTWEPQTGIRIASVAARYTGEQSGFVVVGRSLREVDSRVQQLTAMTAVAAALALITSLLIIFFFKKTEKFEHHTHTEHTEIK
jgi:hypothetical protein